MSVINRPISFLAVTRAAQGLNIVYRVAPVCVQWNDMVYHQIITMSAATKATEIILLKQAQPLPGCDMLAVSDFKCTAALVVSRPFCVCGCVGVNIIWSLAHSYFPLPQHPNVPFCISGRCEDAQLSSEATTHDRIFCIRKAFSSLVSLPWYPYYQKVYPKGKVYFLLELALYYLIG